MHIFRNRPFIGTILTAAIGSCVYYSLNVLWPTQISVLYETDIMMVGWYSCTIGAGAVIGQCLCGVFIKSLGKQKWQLVFTVAALTAFTGGMAAATSSTRALAIAFTLLASIMLGYLENVAFTIAPFCLPQKDIGLALGLLGCMRSSIATIAEAVFVCVLDNKLAVNIPKYVVPAAEQAGLPASSIADLISALSTGVFTGVKGVNSKVIAAAEAANVVAYSESFKVVYLAAIAWGCVGIIAALNAQNSDRFFTEEIARKLHGRDLDKKENIRHSEVDSGKV